jgi:2-iminobutanoate/2-iminopropanoate deaminase
MAIKKQVISVSDARSATAGPPLSAAIKAGDFIFVSGQPPRDFKTGELVFGDIQVQTRQVLENVKVILEAAGSSMDKVVKATVFCSNAGYFNKINEVYKQYFPTEPPARTFVTVGSWPSAFDIEIECIALA